MNNGFTRKMQKRVLAASDGAVFTATDFAEIADTADKMGLSKAMEEVSYECSYTEWLACG